MHNYLYERFTTFSTEMLISLMMQSYILKLFHTRIQLLIQQKKKRDNFASSYLMVFGQGTIKLKNEILWRNTKEEIKL